MMEIEMLTDKELAGLIENVLCSIWENEIKEDFDKIRILNEDTLKNAIYYHLRNRLGGFFDEQDIRILTEFTDGQFAGSGYRPDMVIVKIDMASNAACWRGAVTECLAIIELKMKSRFIDNLAISADYDKLKYYIEEMGVKGHLYMAAIWEYEDDASSWIRKNAAWAKGRVTELNASYKRNSDFESQFYVVKHS